MMYGHSVRRILGTSGLQEPSTYDDPLIKIPGIGIADTGPSGFANMESGERYSSDRRNRFRKELLPFQDDQGSAVQHDRRLFHDHHPGKE